MRTIVALTGLLILSAAPFIHAQEAGEAETDHPAAAEAAEVATPEPLADAPITAVSATMIYDAGAGDQQLAMSLAGAGLYQASLPGMACGTELTYRFEVEAAGGAIVRHPFSSQNSVERLVHATVANGLARTFHDDFETDLGWAVTDSAGLTAGAWERGFGGGYGFRADPPWDADASGQAFYTDPSGGNTDVDGGTTTLTSRSPTNVKASVRCVVWALTHTALSVASTTCSSTREASKSRCIT